MVIFNVRIELLDMLGMRVKKIQHNSNSVRL